MIKEERVKKFLSKNYPIKNKKHFFLYKKPAN